MWNNFEGLDLFFVLICEWTFHRLFKDFYNWFLDAFIV